MALKKVTISSYFRLNRNILECKSNCTTQATYTTNRLNRNILECKCLPAELSQRERQVLIETYWNVNGGAVCSDPSR